MINKTENYSEKMTVFELNQMDYDEADSAATNGLTNGTTVDSAFRKVQKTTASFIIWRVENLSLIAIPRDQYGTFYDADCYLIYAASAEGQPSGTDSVSREIKGPADLHIHFWLGTSAAADKSGIAAYKAVELDGILGGVAIQHRETQGNESVRFKSYFKGGIRVLKGGTGSALKQIISKPQPKLYQIKGSGTPVLTQLESISWSHFNSGDVYIVQTEKILFVWIGRAANAVEKLHSSKIAQQLKIETGIGVIAFIDDGYERTLPDGEKREFQEYLPLDKRHVLPPESFPNDRNYEYEARGQMRLYRCSENSGKYRVTEIKMGPMQQSDLNSDDVFILDNGYNGVWVWVGKRASDKERIEAMRNARGFVKKKRYANNTGVTRVVEGAEPIEFKMLFQRWDDILKKSNVRPAITKFDAITMVDRPALAAETQLVDDGTGATRIWRIKNYDVLEIPKEKHGVFFAGDCYIVWYSYKADEMQHIVYYWLGSQSNNEERQCAALKSKEIDDELDGKTIQVRVVQGFEPPQLLQLFKGRMVVYKGQGTDYDDSGRNMKYPASYLLQINGSTTFSTRALQVSAKATSLNSNYCYVLRQRPSTTSKRVTYVWCGTWTTGDQREMAKQCCIGGALIGTKDFELILEGREPDTFWEVIGGRAPYETLKIQLAHSCKRPARLFHCSTGSGQFKVEEIFNFCQSDLIAEDVMILDGNETIFIWIGKLSTKEENRLSTELAHQYLTTDPSGRNENWSVVKIRQGHEPPNFIGFFSNWDQKFWNNYRCFEEIRSELEGGEFNKSERSMNSVGSNEDHIFDKYDKYPITILKGPMEKLPSKVDPLVKELHLTHDDFVSLFKMKFQEFEILPRWKQQEMKKRVGLF